MRSILCLLTVACASTSSSISTNTVPVHAVEPTKSTPRVGSPELQPGPAKSTPRVGAPLLAPALPNLPPMKTVLLPTKGTPIVNLRLVFRAGSVDDPAGKEGLTALTTRLIIEGGTKSLSAADLNEALFPMAAEFNADTDKELTTVIGRVHQERLERFLVILAEALVAPRLDPKEFERLKTEQLNLIRNRLRNENDEALGKVMLDSVLYPGHPYQHATVGSERGLSAITLDDVTQHWKRTFTKSRLIVGLSGAVDDALKARVLASLSGLPDTGAAPAVIPAPQNIHNTTLVVRRDTASTAGSFGFSTNVRRGHPDFPLLMIGLSYLGQHRQEHGVFYRELRDRRGLNYGTYAYAEHFRQEGWSSIPRPNVARTVQDMSIWLRPVAPSHAVFATRGVLYFLNETLARPLPLERFETAKGFLAGVTRIWTLSDQHRLGWAIDELIYDTPGFLETVRSTIATATAEQVQAALKRHLNPSKLNYVFVTKDAVELSKALASQDTTSIAYSAKKPQDVLEQDKEIAKFPLLMSAPTIVEASDAMH